MLVFDINADLAKELDQVLCRFSSLCGYNAALKRLHHYFEHRSRIKLI
jgi:hypothetical protein